MPKFLIGLVIVVVAFLTVKSIFATSDAYQAYERFSDAMMHDRWDEARKLAGSEKSKRAVDLAESSLKGMGQQTYRMLRGTVHGSPSRKVESEASSPDGKVVTLKVTMEIRRGPHTMAPVGPPTVRHRQEAVLSEGPDGWVVDDWKDESQPIGAGGP
jgi:hypothetical protein